MELTLIEQLAIVAAQGEAEIRTAVMWACLTVLGAGLACAAAWAAWQGYRKFVERVGKGTVLGTVVSVVMLSVFTIYGGSKHLWKFTFENGVHNIGSYCTNDTIHAEWDYAPAYANYALRCAVRDLKFTNEVGVCIDDWHYLEDALVSDMVAEWYVPDATNYEVICYAQYVQPEHVVTNGTYHVGGVMRAMDQAGGEDRALADFVTPGVKIEAYIDDERVEVLTPTNEPPDWIGGALMNMNNTQETEE